MVGPRREDRKDQRAGLLEVISDRIGQLAAEEHPAGPRAAQQHAGEGAQVESLDDQPIEGLTLQMRLELIDAVYFGVQSPSLGIRGFRWRLPCYLRPMAGMAHPAVIRNGTTGPMTSTLRQP